MKTLKERLEAAFIEASKHVDQDCRHVITRSHAIDVALSVLPDWKPIAELPEEFKDGLEILGWWSKSECHSIIYWCKDNGSWCWDGIGSAPTHFKELDEGPSE